MVMLSGITRAERVVAFPAGQLRFTARPCSNLLPFPQAIAEHLVDGEFCVLEVQDDLSAVVCFVRQGITKERHRTSLRALQYSRSLRFGNHLSDCFARFNQ